jgi:hypothetical protein
MRPSTDNPDDAAVGAGLVGRRLTGMERRLPDMANLAISQWSDNRVESEPKKSGGSAVRRFSREASLVSLPLRQLGGLGR